MGKNATSGIPGWIVDVHTGEFLLKVNFSCMMLTTYDFLNNSTFTGQHDFHNWGHEDWAKGNRYFERCGHGKKWYGWKGLDNVGSINTTLFGCGNATLDFGNCSNKGSVVAYKNGEELATVRHLRNTSVTFEFSDLDLIDIREFKSGIILFNNFVQNPC